MAGRLGTILLKPTRKTNKKEITKNAHRVRQARAFPTNGAPFASSGTIPANRLSFTAAEIGLRIGGGGLRWQRIGGHTHDRRIVHFVFPYDEPQRTLRAIPAKPALQARTT